MAKSYPEVPVFPISNWPSVGVADNPVPPLSTSKVPDSVIVSVAASKDNPVPAAVKSNVSPLEIVDPAPVCPEISKE